jgi:hypothetical protein
MDDLDKLYIALIRPPFAELSTIIANADAADKHGLLPWPEFSELLKQHHWTPDEWQCIELGI